MTGSNLSLEFQEIVKQAIENSTPLRFYAGQSKDFLGRAGPGQPLCLAEHKGIVNYEPTELVITARSGTPVSEVETVLDEQGQMLAFEPPHFGAGATLGGTLACGLSGPRRPYAGSARDFVLGTRILNGRGELLKFGGEVMKNVAGYDVSRLMVGALGTLGIMLEISLKVLPRPVAEVTLVHETTVDDAIVRFSDLRNRSLPISAACFDASRLYLRLSGTSGGVRTAQDTLGGDVDPKGEDFWLALREHQLAFFNADEAIWRISVPANTPSLPLAGQWLLDWGGAQRWLRSQETATSIRHVAGEAGGHATLFRNGDPHSEVFHPLSSGLMSLHRSLKTAFDPKGILNPQRMYPQW